MAPLALCKIYMCDLLAQCVNVEADGLVSLASRKMLMQIVGLERTFQIDVKRT